MAEGIIFLLKLEDEMEMGGGGGMLWNIEYDDMYNSSNNYNNNDNNSNSIILLCYDYIYLHICIHIIYIFFFCDEAFRIIYKQTARFLKIMN